ncbi:hypothetical protein [Rhodobacter ferrooxidans]|uniref:Uncharacterized protein n=1 Tax=Rhodobacter ferrooxidans TaxID=371731 RepID=C8S3Z7_9RHOB|nr:hypothetical protein [Rhodobacter sp. SW2]EEW24259.1 hypothetical protein Rsw2DRAFT_2775 [Rhodobacter sp. SW2]
MAAHDWLGDMLQEMAKYSKLNGLDRIAVAIEAARSIAAEDLTDNASRNVIAFPFPPRCGPAGGRQAPNS